MLMPQLPLSFSWPGPIWGVASLEVGKWPRHNHSVQERRTKLRHHCWPAMQGPKKQCAVWRQKYKDVPMGIVQKCQPTKLQKKILIHAGTLR